jgi:hypothetical protein
LWKLLYNIGMKKILGLVVILLSFNQTFSVGGTCSWHKGINCSAGSDIDGSAICNDGWRDSSERYSEQNICQKSFTFCNDSEWRNIKNKYNIDQMQDQSRQNDLDLELLRLKSSYTNVRAEVNEQYRGSGATDSGVQPAIAAKIKEYTLQVLTLQSAIDVQENLFNTTFKNAYSECVDLAERNKLFQSTQLIQSYTPQYVQPVQVQDLCATIPNTHKDSINGLCVCNDGYKQSTTTFQCERNSHITNTTNKLIFTSLLSLGSSGNEVLELQKVLSKLGLLTATPNGYFGNMTKKALMSFQKSNGISQTGMTGPLTRSILNKQ